MNKLLKIQKDGRVQTDLQTGNTTAINYKGAQESYEGIDFSDEAMSELLDAVIDEVMADMGIHFPETDEEVEEALNGRRKRRLRNPDTFFEVDEKEVEEEEEDEFPETET